MEKADISTTGKTVKVQEKAANGTLTTIYEVKLANDGSEAHPYTLAELSAMTRTEYIAAQERLNGTMYVTVGDYSYDKNGTLGNGTADNSDRDSTKLNYYGAPGAKSGQYSDAAVGKNIVFVGGSITSNVTGYASIDNIGTSLLLAVPAYTNVTFKDITFNNVMSFNYQLYTSPWSQLGELKFDNCTFNGIIVGAIAAQTLTFNKCVFGNYTNTTDANSSNPTWIRPAYGNWTQGDNEGQGSDFRSLTKINFTGNTVTSTRPVKFEYISQWDIRSKVTATGNSFDISAQTGDKQIKNVGLYLGAHTDANAFDLVAEGNTKSKNTAALFTIPAGETSLPLGSTVKNSAGEQIKLEDALKWKAADAETGKIVLKTVEAVASIGDTKYASLTEAIAAAKADETVTLLANVNENVEIAAGKNLTLDLNGFILNGGTVAGKAALTNHGTITITDTSAAKTGTIKREDTAENSGVSSHYVIHNQGTMTIESGSVLNHSGYKKPNSTGSMVGSSLICNGDCNEGGTLTIKGGTFTQDNFIAIKNGALGVLHVTGGTITSKHSAIQNWYKATITGGTINGQLWTDAFVWQEGESVGETKIGGDATFAGEIVMDVTGSGVVPKLAITGGNLSVKNWRITTAAADAGAKPAISGGTFKAAVPAEYCAEGFIPVKNADNTYGVKKTTYVAETNGVKYETLQEAINKASRNGTVKMLADTKENVTIAKALTLDLNGFTLNGSTGERKPALTITARIVTIKDSSEAKTGTIMREDTAENSGVSSHYVIDIQGNSWVIFKSGTVKNGSGAGGTKGASLVRVGDDSVEENPGLVINGGTFTQDNFIVIKVDRGYLKLNGGTLNSLNTYAVENWSSAIIKGGTVNGAVAAWTYSDGTNSFLTIEGGTVNGDVTSVNYGNAEGKTATVTITGGTFTGKLDTRSYDPNTGELTSIVDAAKATIKVSGGTFNNAVEARYCDEGYTPVQISDGKYGVQQQQVLAKIGDTAYYTMYEAFHAVQANETIVMQRDYTTGAEQYSGSKSFTIDLNGKTWTYTGTNTNHAAFEINHSDVTLTVKNGTVVSNSMVGLIPSAMGAGGTIAYDNAGLVFEGVTMTANGHSGIETNGTNTNDTVTLKNSTLNVPDGFGIYFPSSGTLAIENSTITAKTMGVQVCAGSLNVTGADTAITVSGDGIEKTGNDGAIQDGAAISIVNRTGYKGLGNVTVTGGTFKANGTNAAIKAYKWENQTASAFDNSKNVVAVSGGTFSSAVPEGLCKDGYISVANGDGTHIVKEGVYVAKVDSVKYETLQKAIDAARGGSTVRLLADVTLTETAVFPAGKKVDLNLVGHNITATGTALLINGTTDIQSTGDVVGTIESTGNVAVAVGNNAKLTVYSGTLKGREGAVITGTSTGAKIEIRKNATLIATDNAVIAGNGSQRDGKPNTINVKGGTLEGGIVTDGYIACGIYAPWNDNVTVSGGTFNITNGAGIVARAGTVKVTGGTFNCGDGQTMGWVGDSKNKVPCAALVFDKAANYPALTQDSNILVSGGSFSTDPAANGATLAAGYVATQTDGMYKVAKADPAAEINGVKYGTLQAAINAAQATKGGATITLLKNINTESYYTVNGDNPVTIDLAGYNITGSGISGLFYVTAKGDLTIKGEGTVTAVEDNGAAMAVWVRSPIAKVTLEGGTYTQQITNIADPHFDLIYVERGNVYVKGGTYNGFTSDWTLNCTDEHYQSKEANIEVTGGTFYGFDPSANHEGAGTTYVKTGYVSTKNGNGTYTVKEYKPVEVWTGYSGTKVASYATIEEAVAHRGDNKWIVIGKDYTLAEDFTIPEAVFFDVAKDATLTVAEGVTLTVAKNAKRLGVRTGATLVNNGTIMVCGTSYSNGYVMVQDGANFDVAELSVPENYFLDNNNSNYFATANADASFEIAYSDGTTKKAKSLTNLAGATKVTLLKDVTDFARSFVSTDKLSDNFVLDLGGYTLSGTTTASGPVLGISVPMTIQNGTIKNVSTVSKNMDPKANPGALTTSADVTIAKDAIIDGGSVGYAIWTAGYGHTLTVNGTVMSNGDYAITGNGSNEYDGATIDIDDCNIILNEGASIKAPNGVAIYHPEKGTVTINGGTISGKTGVQMCSGGLVVNGGSITSNGDNMDATGSRNAIFDGAAISIINRNYPGGVPTAVIKGGTFAANGKDAQTVKAYDYTGDKVAEWTAAGDHVNISGGTFSSIPDNMAALCKVGYRAVEDNGNNVYIVKEANIAIQVTSRIKDDGVTTVSTTTGGGMYCEGEKVTVTTSNVVGFKFLGWYEKDSYMTQLSADLSHTFTASKNCTLVALYSPAENATLTVKVTASAFKITGSKWVQNNGGMYKLPVGSSVTVTYTDETYTFLYWVNGSDKIVSTSPEYTFTLGSNTELRACTSPRNTEPTNAMVVFKTAYDQVLTAQRYDVAEEIVFPMGPSKTGYKFLGWSMTQAEIRAAMAKNDYIVVTPEYETLGSKYTVTVKYEGIGKADDTHTINVGDSILLTAETEVDGKTFSCWKIGDEVVSYLTTLTVFDTEDVTVTAMYGEKVTAEATIRITGVTTGRNGNYYQLIFSESYAVPETATFVQTGFVGTASAATAENLTLDTGTPFVSKLDVPEGSYEYTMNLSRPTMTVYMKAYVQYMENGKLQTLYSDMVSASYNSLTEGGNN